MSPRLHSASRAAAVFLLLGGFILALAGQSAGVAGGKPPKGLEHSFKRYPVELGRVTFAAAGDVIPHQAVKQAAEKKGGGGWEGLLSGVADVFLSSDFGFANLETPVCPRSTKGSAPFRFDAPVTLLDGLCHSGITAVSFANNHVYDQGREGFAETVEVLRGSGLAFAGAGLSEQEAWEPAILEKNGIRVGLVAITRWLNGARNPEKADTPHAAFVPYADDHTGVPGRDEDFALGKVREARGMCDLLLVSVHWGVEYAPEPRKEDIAFAHALVEAGAGLILGHHPHVLQPAEVYPSSDGRHAVILYSMGNFLSNQARRYSHGLTPEKTGEMRDSLVALFAAVKRDYGPAGVRVELGDMGLLPAWGENGALAPGAEKEGPEIGPLLLDREILKARARAEALQALGPGASAAEKSALLAALKRLDLLQRRRELILLRVGDDFIVPPPPLP